MKFAPRWIQPAFEISIAIAIEFPGFWSDSAFRAIEFLLLNSIAIAIEKQEKKTLFGSAKSITPKAKSATRSSICHCLSEFTCCVLRQVF